MNFIIYVKILKRMNSSHTNIFTVFPHIKGAGRRRIKTQATNQTRIQLSQSTNHSIDKKFLSKMREARERILSFKQTGTEDDSAQKSYRILNPEYHNQSKKINLSNQKLTIKNVSQFHAAKSVIKKGENQTKLYPLYSQLLGDYKIKQELANKITIFLRKDKQKKDQSIYFINTPFNDTKEVQQFDNLRFNKFKQLKNQKKKSYSTKKHRYKTIDVENDDENSQFPSRLVRLQSHRKYIKESPRIHSPISKHDKKVINRVPEENMYIPTFHRKNKKYTPIQKQSQRKKKLCNNGCIGKKMQLQSMEQVYEQIKSSRQIQRGKIQPNSRFNNKIENQLIDQKIEGWELNETRNYQFW